MMDWNLLAGVLIVLLSGGVLGVVIGLTLAAREADRMLQQMDQWKKER